MPSTTSTWASPRRTSPSSTASAARNRTSSPPSSQQKAERAVADGIFRDEIVPIEVPVKGGTRMVDSDEAPRAGTTADTLAKLRTAFRRDGGTVTAGNASGINDGASAIVVMSATHGQRARPADVWDGRELRLRRRRAEDHGHRPGARRAQGAGQGGARARRHRPVRAQRGVRGAVARRAPGARHRPERINPHGGAIALGHPIGASGGRILVTLLHEMRRRDAGAASPRSASAAVKGRRRSSATAPTSRAMRPRS